MCAIFLGAYSQCGYSTDIQGIRDGVVHFKVEQKPLNFSLVWNEAWHAKENKETIYLQGPTGQLIEELVIEKSDTDGKKTWVLPPSANGSYRLEIPGYSFRKYHIYTERDVPLVYEPVKHHFTIDSMKHQTWFFKKAANQQLSIGGKFHGGVDKLAVKCGDASDATELSLAKSQKYSDNDVLALGLATEIESCVLTLNGNGKAAFWIDGDHNYFSTSSDTWFYPQPLRLNTQIEIGEVIGKSPKLGVAVPNAVPPKPVTNKLEPLQMKTMSSYLFSDSFNLTHQIRDYYAAMGVASDLAIIAKANRIAVLDDPKPTIDVAKLYFDEGKSHVSQQKYVALADEPNLNYGSYEAFETYFIKAATQIKADSSNAKIAAPASSRFFNAPTHLNASSRSGLDWAKKLLQKNPELIDAIAWNEWLYRDLINTSAIKDSINEAVKLVGVDKNGQPNKPLIIGQTNISSGLHLSPYEQNTFFAALWWASTAIQASDSGQLEAINWFHLVDEKAYPKGMLTEYPALEYKPVAYAMVFMSNAWYSNVHQVKNDRVDFDVLALSNDDDSKLSILMVNKSRNTIKPSIDFLNNKWKLNKVSTLNEQGYSQEDISSLNTLQVGSYEMVRLDYIQ